jgi:hypothetical protein
VWRDDDRIASIYGIHGRCCAPHACGVIRIILHARTSATKRATVCTTYLLRISLSGSETTAKRLLLGDFPPPAELQPLYMTLRVRLHPISNCIMHGFESTQAACWVHWCSS